MNEREFQIVSSALDDCRRLIAAGKVQRWDVVKWGVTVNLALATASAAIGPKFGASIALYIVAALVSFGSWSLVWHYNRRMTGARQTATAVVAKLNESGVNYDKLLQTNVAREYAKGNNYDREELLTFGAILAIAPFLVLLRLWIG